MYGSDSTTAGWNKATYAGEKSMTSTNSYAKVDTNRCSNP